MSLGLDSFTTPRLQAERLREGHWGELRSMDGDEGFMHLLGGVRDESGSAAYLAHNLSHWAEHGYGLWMLRDRASGAIIGRAVLRHLLVDGIDEVEVGYGFMPTWWGRGLATEIARACVRLGLDRLRRPSLVAVTRPEHVASRRVLEKVGLEFEREVLVGGEGLALFRTRGRTENVGNLSTSERPTSRPLS